MNESSHSGRYDCTTIRECNRYDPTLACFSVWKHHHAGLSEEVRQHFVGNESNTPLEQLGPRDKCLRFTCRFALPCNDGVELRQSLRSRLDRRNEEIQSFVVFEPTEEEYRGPLG